jgi:uncharacterized protein (TIGR03790 family)
LADLQPGDVAIIAARGNAESDALAKYYARVRGVPAANICLVDVPQGEVCPRDTWRWGIRPEIQKWLVEHDPQQKIRCLVTVWGVPLKIGPASPDAQSQRHQQFLAAERTHRLELLGQVLDGFDRIAPDASTAEGGEKTTSVTAEEDGSNAASANSQPGKLAPNPNQPAGGAVDQSDSELSRIQTRLESALQRAQARLANLPEGDSRNRNQLQLQQLATAAGGLNVLLPALSQRLAGDAAGNAQARSEFDMIRGRMAGYLETKALLEQMPVNLQFDALILAVLERASGLIGTVQWLDQQLQLVKKNETAASFDSELALVMWPEDYQLLRWQPNYLRTAFSNSQLPAAYRTLMVSRIDAPTLRLAKGLIDTAIEVEKKGLRGKVYIDARGLADAGSQNQQQGSHADYDHSLSITATGIKEQTDLEVVLEATPQLFQPGQCPDAALYCGWYSLAKYVDAFDWAPGAVAYHLASSEADTLRSPASQVWCKKLLEDGVCATIGPVYEPYLSAFPRPNEFFALLLQGDLTLVECYARSNPFNSWMMILVGDPLYRPFKAGPPTSRPAGTP